MYDLRIIFMIGLLCSLSIVSNRSINAQQTDNSSQNSSTSIDRQMSVKDLPNDKELSFKTMEPGCTITV
jgi:hypothetical protein